jgi:hypothetical protein
MNKQLEILKRIRDEGPEKRSCGICWNFCVMSEGDYLLIKFDLLEKYEISMENWEKYSGNESYWICSTHPEIANEGDAYLCSSDKWLGSYGELRMECLNWLISQLENKLKERNEY